MTKPAAIYCRISRDREGGGLGVERQEQECRQLAERLGLSIGEVHTDNDLSAYSGKPRPGYKALLARVKDGQVDTVLVWHTDRLHRSPVELEEWIALAEPRGVVVRPVRAGELDLATASGRMTARIVGAVARHESEHKSERIRSQKVQATAAGKYRGGPRPFGFESDGVTPRPAEAGVLVDATDRVLAGESVISVCRTMNAAGFTTSSGKTWEPRTLRRVLNRARNAGLIEHEGVVVGRAAWPAIVDPAKWRNLRRLLADPARRVSPSNDRRWLGSGLYICGRCNDGTTVRSGTAKSLGLYEPAYKCPRFHHLSRLAEPVDDLVADIVIERLGRNDARTLLVPEARRVDLEVVQAQRDDVEAQLIELGTLFATRQITGPQMAEATRTLQAEAEGLDAQLSSATGVSALTGIVDAPDVRAAWNAVAVGRRKAVVRELMTVTVLPAPKGRPAGWKAGEPYFDPRAVRIGWRR